MFTLYIFYNITLIKLIVSWREKRQLLAEKKNWFQPAYVGIVNNKKSSKNFYIKLKMSPKLNIVRTFLSFFYGNCRNLKKTQASSYQSIKLLFILKHQKVEMHEIIVRILYILWNNPSSKK